MARRSQFPTTALEDWAIRERFPRFRLVDRRRPRWRGTVQARPDGLVFTVEIDSGYVRPRARIVSPPLVNVPGRSLPPHHYSKDNICLFHPDHDVFDSRQPIALTILPWVHEWCFYYEMWLLTGRWLGPEHDHREPKAPESKETAA